MKITFLYYTIQIWQQKWATISPGVLKSVTFNSISYDIPLRVWALQLGYSLAPPIIGGLSNWNEVSKERTVKSIFFKCVHVYFICLLCIHIKSVLSDTINKNNYTNGQNKTLPHLQHLHITPMTKPTAY